MSNKVAFITGSAKGLGKAIALHLGQQGYKVILHYYKSKHAIDAFTTELEDKNISFQIVQGDLKNENSVKEIVEKIKQNNSNLDLLVNNVGNYLKKNVLENTFDDWHEMLQSNLLSAVYCTQSLLPLIRKSEQGKIVNVGFASLGKNNAQSDITPYYIAKTGLLLYTKSLAKELASENITVNMLSPGVLENSESKPLVEIPMNRVASFEEFNHSLDFLLSEKANYITGTNIEVAGGWRL